MLVYRAVPAVGAAGVPSSARNFTSSSFAFVMSLRIVVEMEEDTKLKTENKTIGTASIT